MVVSARGRPGVVAGLRLVRPVGRGGEGEVWEVRDQRGHLRALKLIRPDVLAGDAEARGRLLLRIDHPALVRVHRGGRLTAGPLAGWGYVEMDYVDGDSLQSAPADPQVLDRLQPLAEALDLLHVGAWSAGLPLVHRDVKPANLIRTPDGRLVLVDPSTLRGVDATQLTRIGTPVFSAPEILTGRIGPAADVYSFAVTVLALTSGARGERLADLVAEAGASDHPQQLVDLPAGVRQALAPSPGDRPVSCRAVLESSSALARGDLLVPWRRSDPDTGRVDWPGPPDTARNAAPGGGPGQAEAEPARPAGPAWPWLLVLAAIVGGPTLGWALGLLRGRGLVVGVAAATAAHLAAHAVARRPLPTALAVPPAAWAFLLAERIPGSPRRRAWTRTVLVGALGAETAVLVDAVGGGRFADGPQAVGALVVAGLALAGVALRAPSLQGRGGLAMRLALVPVWLVGAGLLLGAAVLAVALAPLLGSLRPAARLAGSTLSSALEAFRSPARA